MIYAREKWPVLAEKAFAWGDLNYPLRAKVCKMRATETAPASL